MNTHPDWLPRKPLFTYTLNSEIQSFNLFHATCSHIAVSMLTFNRRIPAWQAASGSIITGFWKCVSVVVAPLSLVAFVNQHNFTEKCLPLRRFLGLLSVWLWVVFTGKQDVLFVYRKDKMLETLQKKKDSAYCMVRCCFSHARDIEAPHWVVSLHYRCFQLWTYSLCMLLHIELLHIILCIHNVFPWTCFYPLQPLCFPLAMS